MRALLFALLSSLPFHDVDDAIRPSGVDSYQHADGVASGLPFDDLHLWGADSTVFYAPLASSTDATINRLGSVTASFSRATSAAVGVYSAAVTATIFHVESPGVARFGTLLDSTSTAFVGYLGEPAATNIELYSSQIDLWSSPFGTTITADQGADAYGNTTLDKIADTAVLGLHGVQAASVSMSASTDYVCSAVLKDGTRGYGGLIAGWPSTKYALFNLSSGANTLCTSPSVCGSINLGGGRWRAWIASNTGATTVSRCAVVLSNDGTSTSYTGDGSYIYAGSRQTELGAYPTSIIETTTTAVTRNADVLSYSFAAPVSGTVALSLLCPARDLGAQASLLSLSDGDINDTASLHVAASGDVARWLLTSGGTDYVDISGTTDVFDNTQRTARGWFSSSLSRLYVGGSQEGSDDTSATVPTASTLYLGDGAGASQSGCLVSGVQVYRGQTKRSK